MRDGSLSTYHDLNDKDEFSILHTQAIANPL